MRSSYDVLPSPVNLARCEVQKDNKCRYGEVKTMKHILSNLQIIGQIYYTWRHNEVLRVFTQVAEEMAEEGKYAQKHRKLLPSEMFVPEGGKIPVEKQKISLAESESYGQ